MTNKDNKYFQFPLMMIKQIYENRHGTIDDIMTFGIMNYAYRMRLPTQGNQVIGQVIYDYHKAGPMTSKLKSFINKFNLSIDEDYNGFDGQGNFDPDPDYFADWINAYNLKPGFRELCNEHFSIKSALKFMGITQPDYDNITARFVHLTENYSGHKIKYGSDPWPGIEKGLAFDFRDNNNDPEMIAAYIAIRSLIGQHKWVMTTKRNIAIRMTGAKSEKVLQGITDKRLTEVFAKYSKRRPMDNILNRLYSRGLIKARFGYAHKIYLSCTLTNDDVINEMRLRKERNNQKARQAEAVKKLQLLVYDYQK